MCDLPTGRQEYTRTADITHIGFSKYFFYTTMWFIIIIIEMYIRAMGAWEVIDSICERIAPLW